MPVLNPYLTFRDSARAAMEFYHRVFGGELEFETFGESSLAHEPGDAELILHGVLETVDGMVLMASDTPTGVPYEGAGGHAISISGDEEEDLSEWWEQLSAGGTILVPLSEPDWGGLFGMCIDRFGVRWMISILDEDDLDEDAEEEDDFEDDLEEE
ncbi:VOC family protein [Microbacterium stercoris]|uniref:VOC family protein n=1 Tax=Microbacterium stercoris TaxID=2820289 RepID=A0A939TMB1_9MICO|nr:VOC family protein [Microbacterium stercoris]MBO3663013.1 VOC family protein [Microbacterium stercoris]